MALPHIILFAQVNCSGIHTHVCESLSYIGDYFNDVTSSFVILEGNWQFFVDAGFAGQMGADGGKTLGPGVYNWIEDNGALGPQTNDRLSSLKSV
jgi:hypothetical protein